MLNGGTCLSNQRLGSGYLFFADSCEYQIKLSLRLTNRGLCPGEFVFGCRRQQPVQIRLRLRHRSLGTGYEVIIGIRKQGIVASPGRRIRIGRHLQLEALRERADIAPACHLIVSSLCPVQGCQGIGQIRFCRDARILIGSLEQALE